MSNTDKRNLNSLTRIYELKDIFLIRMSNGVPNPALHLNQAMSNWFSTKNMEFNHVNNDDNHTKNN